MKKKIVSALLCVSMVATMVAGCGGTDDTAADTGAADAGAAAPATEAAADAADAGAADAGSGLTYTGDLNIMHYSTSEESEGNGGSDGFRTRLITKKSSSHRSRMRTARFMVFRL